jgi:hypothetical protein
MADNSFAPFPHHRLISCQVALEFVRLMRSTPIADAESRKHANASAASCARNLGEGAGRRRRFWPFNSRSVGSWRWSLRSARCACPIVRFS